MKLLVEINTRYKASLFSHMYLVLPEILQLIEQSRKRAEEIFISQHNASVELVRVTKEAIYYLPMFDVHILDDHLYLIVPLLLRTAQKGRMS